MLTLFKEKLYILVARVTPTTLAWRGAADGILVVGLFTLSLSFYFSNISHFSWQKLPAFAVLVGSLFLLGLGVLFAVYVIVRLPSRYRLTLALIAPFLTLSVFPGAKLTGYIAGASVLLACSLVGAGCRVLAQSGANYRQHPMAVLAVVSGILILSAGTYAIFSDKDIANPSLQNYVLDGKALALPNPGLAGAYTVAQMTYGSGKDRQRSEYGTDVDLRSRSVDGSKLIDNWEGVSGWLRTSYWGFDVTELPLQGRVWYPEGEGPFPLVLIVHGNHGMEDYSDPGYDYLGELFASRGIILASVDENFINGTYSARVDLTADRPGLKEENDARGWLLLEHLAQFREWNTAPGNPFFGKIDMDKLALIGHSRGGEAVGVAAAFNSLSRYPDDASLEFNFNFNLRGVIAIAPVYGQYEARERPTPIRDVNYLTVHGNMDGDVQSFEGVGQYSRVSFSGDDYRFRASLYIVGANHGQFNTTWENMDTSPFRGWSLDTGRLMQAQEQRDVARVYFSAFLEIVFNEKLEYLPLLKDARYGASWLPNTFFINQFSDSNEHIVVDFENDLEPSTLDLKGGTIETTNLSRWYEVANELKKDELDTHSVVVAWDKNFSNATASITFSLGQPASGEVMVASLSSAGISSTPPGWQNTHKEGAVDNNKTTSEELEAQENAKNQPLDWTIELADNAGNRASLLLSTDSVLYPLIKSIPYRAKFLDDSKQEEVLFRRFEFPITDFQASNPLFDADAITEIKFVFDQSPKGAIILDSISID
jgi:dienelactone hydrolase